MTSCDSTDTSKSAHQHRKHKRRPRIAIAPHPRSVKLKLQDTHTRTRMWEPPGGWVGRGCRKKGSMQCCCWVLSLFARRAVFSAYCVAPGNTPAQRRQGQRHCAGEGSLEDGCSKSGGGEGSAVWHEGGGVEDEAVPLCLKSGAHACIGSRGANSPAAIGLLWTT